MPPAQPPASPSANPSTPHVGAWTIPTVNFDISSENATLPYTIIDPQHARHSYQSLTNLAALTNQPIRDLAVFNPQRILLQESISSVVTGVQLQNNAVMSYDADLAQAVQTVSSAIPREQAQAYETRMNQLYEQTYDRMLAAAATDGAGLTPGEKQAFDQARGEVTKVAEKYDVRLLGEETKEAVFAKRAAGLVYEQAARQEAGTIIHAQLEKQFQAGTLKPLTTHDRRNTPIAMINGGQASGKGYNVSILETQMAQASGLEQTDRVYVNGDAAKLLLAGKAQQRGDLKYIQSQLVQDEVALIKNRAMSHLRQAERIPNVIIDQVYPAPMEIKLGTEGKTPMRLVVVATDVETAINRSFARGEEMTAGRYEHTEGILTVHRNVSKDLSGIIAANMGKDIALEIYDNNVAEREPKLIMRGDLKAGAIEVLDPIAASRFFNKSAIDTKAQSVEQVYSRKPVANLGFLAEIMTQSPHSALTISAPDSTPETEPILTLKDGKLTAVNAQKLRAELEAAPELNMMLRASKDQLSTPAISMAKQVKLSEAIPAPKPTAQPEPQKRPLLHKLDSAFNPGAPEPEAGNGNRSKYERGKPIAEIPMNGVLAVGPIEDFTFSDNATRNEHATTFARDVSERLHIAPERMVSYVHPHPLNEAKLNADVGRFVDEAFVARITTQGPNGEKIPLPAEEAAKRMRINVVTHSFGGNFIDEAGIQFDAALKKMGYSDAERTIIAQQVKVVNMGGAPSLDADMNIIKSPFDTARLVGKHDTSIDTLWEVADPDSKSQGRYIELDTPEKVTVSRNGASKQYSDSHGRMSYFEGIRSNGALLKTVQQSFDAPATSTVVSLAEHVTDAIAAKPKSTTQATHVNGISHLIEGHGRSGSPMRDGEAVLTPAQNRLAEEIGTNRDLLQQRLNPAQRPVDKTAVPSPQPEASHIPPAQQPVSAPKPHIPVKAIVETARVTNGRASTILAGSHLAPTLQRTAQAIRKGDILGVIEGGTSAAINIGALSEGYQMARVLNAEASVLAKTAALKNVGKRFGNLGKKLPILSAADAIIEQARDGYIDSVEGRDPNIASRGGWAGAKFLGGLVGLGGTSKAVMENITNWQQGKPVEHSAKETVLKSEWVQSADWILKQFGATVIGQPAALQEIDKRSTQHPQDFGDIASHGASPLAPPRIQDYAILSSALPALNLHASMKPKELMQGIQEARIKDFAAMPADMGGKQAAQLTSYIVTINQAEAQLKNYMADKSAHDALAPSRYGFLKDYGSAGVIKDNEAAYLKANPDAAAAVKEGRYKTGFEHFVREGVFYGASFGNVSQQDISASQGEEIKKMLSHPASDIAHDGLRDAARAIATFTTRTLQNKVELAAGKQPASSIGAIKTLAGSNSAPSASYKNFADYLRNDPELQARRTGLDDDGLKQAGLTTYREQAASKAHFAGLIEKAVGTQAFRHTQADAHNGKPAKTLLVIETEGSEREQWRIVLHRMGIMPESAETRHITIDMEKLRPFSERAYQNAQPKNDHATDKSPSASVKHKAGDADERAVAMLSDSEKDNLDKQIQNADLPEYRVATVGTESKTPTGLQTGSSRQL